MRAAADLPAGTILRIAERAGREITPVRGRRGEARVRCPWSAEHQNEDTHPSCRLNPEKNTFYCDPCGRGGGVKDFAEALEVPWERVVPGNGVSAALPIARPTMKKAEKRPLHFEPSGPVTEATRDHLATHMRKDYRLETWHLLRVQEGRVGDRPAIAFPLPTGGWKVCLYRLPDRRRGKAYSWRFTDGGKPCLLIVGEGDDVLLVAGEWDMLAALDAGIAHVATGTAGEGTWQPAWSEQLRGLRVWIIYDVDSGGTRGAGRVAAALQGIASRVRVIPLPLSGRAEEDGKDLSDFLVVHTVEELRRLLTDVADQRHEGRQGIPLSRHQANESLPRVVINRQMREVASDAWDAVLLANRDVTQVFLRRDHLVELADDGAALAIRPLDETRLFGRLIRTADWVREKRDGEAPASPPSRLVLDLLAYPHPELPKLDDVLYTPVIAPRGTLLADDGFYPAERLYLDLRQLRGMPRVPTSPSASEVEAARSLLLDDLLVDFPFLENSDRAHAVAALILPLVRPAVPGCTPLHLAEAPIPGSGKGLLCNVIAICATGRACLARAIPSGDDDIRKMLTAELMAGRPIVLLDNVRERRRLDSAALSALLTSEQWTDRILGETRMISAPNRALWLLTGNNPHLSMELARRCVRIRIDPQVDRPWKRAHFKHPALLEWTAENRPRLVHAILTLAAAWVAAGCPRASRRLGSFERWSEVLGGILGVARIQGFLGNLEDFYERADAEGQAWREFTAAWWERFGSEAQRVADLQALCHEDDLLADVRGDGTDRSQQTRLGQALLRARDRVFGRFRIVQAHDAAHKGRTYALRLVERTEGDPSGGGEPQGNLGVEVPKEVPLVFD